MLVPRLRRLAPYALALALPPLAPGLAHAQPAPPRRGGAPGGAPGSAPGGAPRGEGTQGAPQQKTRLSDAVNNRKATYHMDFDKVDILEVIKYLSQWTGKNFILPDNVRGKITIIGPTEVTADEAYAAFLAALESNNLTITPTGRFYKIVPKKDSIRTSIPTFEPDGKLLPMRSGESQVPLNEQMVTKLFRLKYNDADPIKNVLQQFITREGEIVPFPPDVLIVSDNALNIHRLDNLIEQLDQPGVADEINVLQVEHAGAQELANTLLQIFQAQGGQPGGAGGRKPNIAVAMPREAGGGAAAQAGGAQEGGTTSVSKIIPDERTNKLIVIASGKSFQRIAALVKKLDVPTDTGGVHVYYLENADAEELAGTLSALASGQSSGSSSKRRAGAGGGPGGGQPMVPSAPAGGGAGGATSAALFSGEVKVTAEKSTNSLLIIASPGDYRNMVRVIQQLDIRRRQVFIEAVIMEVKLNNNNKWSLDFNGGYALENVQLPGTDKGTAPIVFGSELSAPGASLSLGSLASLNGFIAGIQGPPIRIDGLNITLPSFGVVLNALQKNSDVNVISTPHILTSDNEDAEITVGSNVPFQSAVTPSLGSFGGLSSLGTGLSSSAGLNSTLGSSLLGLGGLGGFGAFGVPIQRQPVQLQLKLKPQINESDFVRLEIDEQVEEISSIDQRLGPTTAKRGVKTTIVAKDQSTVVIGGLIQERTTRSETKVPILGSIPILGKLFRSEDTTKEKTNLLLFLTPYIIRDQADFRRIFERKMKERQEFVARFFGASDTYQVTVDYERKRGPLGVLRRALKDEFDKVENGGAGAPGERVITPGQVPQQQKQPQRGDVEHYGEAPNGGPILLPNQGAQGGVQGVPPGGPQGAQPQAPAPERRPDEQPPEPAPE